MSRNHRKYQIHIQTAIGLSFCAGVFLYMNLTPKLSRQDSDGFFYIQEYGWPFMGRRDLRFHRELHDFKKIRALSEDPMHSTYDGMNITLDLVIFLVCMVIVYHTIEQAVVTRVAAQPTVKDEKTLTQPKDPAT